MFTCRTGLTSQTPQPLQTQNLRHISSLSSKGLYAACFCRRVLWTRGGLEHVSLAQRSSVFCASILAPLNAEEKHSLQIHTTIVHGIPLTRRPEACPHLSELRESHRTLSQRPSVLNASSSLVCAHHAAKCCDLFALGQVYSLIWTSHQRTFGQVQTQILSMRHPFLLHLNAQLLDASKRVYEECFCPFCQVLVNGRKCTSARRADDMSRSEAVSMIGDGRRMAHTARESGDVSQPRGGEARQPRATHRG